MAYDILWQCSFLDIDGNRNFVNVRDRDYTGAATNVRGGASPIVVKLNGDDKDIYQPVRKTQAVLQFVSETKQQFIACKTGDGRKYKVEWVRRMPASNGVGTVDVIEWQGWIATDLYSEQYVSPQKYIVSIICHDGLGDLETIEYDPLKFDAAVSNFDKVGWKYYITQLLKLTDLDLSIDGQVGINAEDSGTATFDDFASTSMKGFGETHCFDVLEQLLRSAGTTLRQNRGMWNIFVPNDQARFGGVAPHFLRARQELTPLPSAKMVQVNAGYRYIDFGLGGWNAWKRYDTGTAIEDVLAGWDFSGDGQNTIDSLNVTDEGVEIPVAVNKHVDITNVAQNLTVQASNTQNFVFGIEIDFRYLQKAVVRIESDGGAYVLTTNGWQAPVSGNNYGNLELIPSDTKGGTEQFKITSQPIPFSGTITVLIKIYAFDSSVDIDGYTGGLAVLKNINITLLDNLADSRTGEKAETNVNTKEKEIYSLDTALATIDNLENYAMRYCGFVYNENTDAVSSKFRLKNTATAYYSLQQLLLLMYAKTYKEGPWRIKCDLNSTPNGFAYFDDLISDDGRTYMLLQGSLDCRSRQWSNCTFAEITEGIEEGLSVDASLRTDANGNPRSTGGNNEYRIYSMEAGVGKRIRDLETATAIDLNTVIEVDAIGFSNTKKVALSAIAAIVATDLTGYATEQWVIDQNYALKTDLHTHDNKIVIDALDFNGNYLERNGGEVWVANADRLDNIVAADYFNKYNSNLPTINWEMADAIVNGTFTTKNFAPGIVGGVGGRMDQAGNMELQSLIVREFIRTPELIKNQVRVAGNEFWFTDPGIIQDVSGTGPYTITYKIEEGDGVSHKVDDILIGIYNDGNGFETAYFDVVSVDLANNHAVLNSRNGIAPKKFMVLARKGNETDTDRQTSVFVDGLNGFIRVLGGVNDHNTDFSNIITQIGYLNMHSAVFGDMNKGIYVKDNGYFENIKVSGEIYVTGGNAETQTGAQSKADAAESAAVSVAATDATNKANAAEAAATGVANAAQTKADSAYNLADLKITEADAVTITHREIKAPYIATLGLKVGDEILMGENAVISWDKVTGGQAAIDAVQIGGKNLIKGSNRLTDTDLEAQYYVTENDGAFILSRLNSNSRVPAIGTKDSINSKMIIGQEYTFSAEVYRDLNVQNPHIWINSEGGIVDKEVSLYPYKWTVISHTFIYHGGITELSIFVKKDNGNEQPLYVRNMKLEKGNKATDWTPAPEDIDAEIATKITNAEATVITNNTIATTTVIAESLQVRAANILDQLSADKIDVNSLVVKNVKTATVGKRIEIDAASNTLKFTDNDGFLSILIDDYIYGSHPGIKMYNGVLYMEDSTDLTFIKADQIITPMIKPKRIELTSDSEIAINLGSSWQNGYTGVVYRYQIDKLHIKNGLIYDLTMV